ncbi:MAG: alpha,alpha-trehalose-phosphate synthase (UDP-forming) [Thermoguttaceae bacterium]
MNLSKKNLEQAVRNIFGQAKLIAVANREPYIHVYDGAEIICRRPASGLATALDPVMRACGGVWVAHGGGTADRAMVDERNRVAVPPEKPSYTLRRVWLTKQQEQGYYYGFANEGIWPLCHIAYMRPKFSEADWEQYQAVNQKFADAILDEAADEPAVVFVQDYHFALLPRMLKKAREDLVVAQFWHIPWPNREVFRICPWQAEILDGLLGNDLLAFHIQYHCNNFLDTVDRTIEARVDMEHFAVTRGGSTTLVRPHPISIDPELITDTLPMNIGAEEKKIRRRLGLRSERIIVGVDRIDYTKGIPDRFRALARLFDRHPELQETITLVQIGAPSRLHIPEYRRLNDELDQLVEDINWRYGQDSWRPIVFLNELYEPKEIYALYQIADICVVSSLHDGMNLVAKEFVATRQDLQGVLVLSCFTGAARELTDALVINPYAIDDFAETLYQALTMPPEEQEFRMRRMREQITEHNIYHWAGDLLAESGKLADIRQPVGETV